MTILEEVSNLQATLLVYESPRRVGETLFDLKESLGNRRACVARELTKVHEEVVRGDLASLAERYQGEEVLGEVVVVVEGRVGDQRWSQTEPSSGLFPEGLTGGEKAQGALLGTWRSVQDGAVRTCTGLDLGLENEGHADVDAKGVILSHFELAGRGVHPVVEVGIGFLVRNPGCPGKHVHHSIAVEVLPHGFLVCQHMLGAVEKLA